ncbi:MAG: UDP-3-O-acyl-N-acetylglucosamine deacetylase [Alphaproteobacteria bacterium]|nr:UDP-3-O-acyl-N-acetylglucosamine deacetylase [Alphaproteobacteria bacterium]MDA8003570.1 UDP-3-O-acyl-N-acetylglucosamine deacetylase [Alphaproteobacteria bacterium]MDA8004950.1 UDP-3-O-acyl-N-acetylglucosamine deacetylase [Alphaproteobacteria bacterium]MDA8012330.1 UDP-3-O-acyl-N-acetylglucosamine deacetylase [Alphaproteobacteria bacterium]
MDAQPQTTIAAPVSWEGYGLHRGRHGVASVLPAEENVGYRIRKSGGDPKDDIKVSPLYAEPSPLQTQLRRGGQRAYTVEHLLSACYGLGLDNVVIELSEEEPPILDGSAFLFARDIHAAGVREQGAPRRVLEVAEPFTHSEGATEMRFLPSSALEIVVEIDFEALAIGYQRLEICLTPERYLREVAPARTFLLREDLPFMRRYGLGRGGNLKNAIIVDGARVHSQEPLRFADEFVRHKLLDLVGDLALLGAPLRGRVEVNRPGHSVTINALREWTTKHPLRH